MSAAAPAKTPSLSPIPGAEVCVSITSGQAYVSYLEGNQENHVPISMAQALRIFSDCDIDTGWLPPGVARCAETSRGSMVLSYRPPSPATILLDGRKGEIDALTIPLPGLAMLGVDTKYYLWSLKEAAFSQEAIIHHAPLPNINGDGTVCFGANKVPRASGDSVSKVWALFWESPFSDHSVQGKSGAHPNDIRKVIRDLAKRRRARAYPTADLVRFKRGLSVRQAWDDLVRYGQLY